jgi:hypothetical protein
MKMRTKTRFVGIFILLVIAISAVGFTFAEWVDYVDITGTASTNDLVVGIEDGSITVGDCEATGPLTLSDDELGTEFAWEYGPGTVAAITDIAGLGVQFDFTGLQAGSGTIVGDNFPVSSKAGGASKTYGSTSPFTTDGDFSMYRSYRLRFYNPNITDCMVNVAINTGWTNPATPEWGAAWRDTYWQNGWTALAAGETKVVTLYFDDAEVYNAGDEEDFGVYADGTTGLCIWRIDEVSDVKFQVLGTGAGSLIVSAVEYEYKDIGSCTFTPGVPDTSGSGGHTVYHEGVWTIVGAYPSYHQYIMFNLLNDGSVPAHIDGVTLTYDDTAMSICMWKYDANVGYEWDYARPLVCNQLDPGVCEWVVIWIHFKQAAVEGANYPFTIEIDVSQWNE